MGTSGSETKAALKKEVKTGTYPGAVIALGANDGIPYLSEGIKKTLARQVDNGSRVRSGFNLFLQ